MIEEEYLKDGIYVSLYIDVKEKHHYLKYQYQRIN